MDLQPQLRLQRALEAPLPPARPLPPGHVVRAYAPGDEAAWARLLHDNRQLGDWDEARLQRMIVRDHPALLLEGVFCVEHHRTLLATACTLRHQPVALRRELLEIGWVAVAPAARGQHLAYAVSRHLLAYWQPRTAAEVFILTDDWRLPAIITYLRLDFRPQVTHPSHPARWRAVAAALPRDLHPAAAPPAAAQT